MTEFCGFKITLHREGQGWKAQAHCSLHKGFYGSWRLKEEDAMAAAKADICRMVYDEIAEVCARAFPGKALH